MTIFREQSKVNILKICSAPCFMRAFCLMFSYICLKNTPRYQVKKNITTKNLKMTLDQAKNKNIVKKKCRYYRRNVNFTKSREGYWHFTKLSQIQLKNCAKSTEKMTISEKSLANLLEKCAKSIEKTTICREYSQVNILKIVLPHVS